MKFPSFTFKTLFSLLVAACIWIPVQAWSGEATRQVEETVKQAIAILEDPQMGGPEKHNARREKLRTVLMQRFDFEKMSQSALGRKWLNFNPDQRRRFVTLFRKILEDAYADKIEGYQGEPFSFTKETLTQDRFAQVDSVVVFKGQSFGVSYRMVLENGQWLVYDVIIEGIGLVANYRSQFDQILQRESIEDL
ncbi:MAG: ABC transporter substrate-binding protein, partial [Magnetococcales bacterium]|nr:ABC transporter substrate-binding protein [Magnetococcales bacterium]